MELTREYFSYFKDYPKMVAIDVSVDSVTFLLAKREGLACSFLYDILDLPLYEICTKGRNPIIEDRIKRVATFFNIQRNTPVFISFSHDIEIYTDSSVLKNKDIRRTYFVVPFTTKKDLESPEYVTIYIATPKKEVIDILNFLDRCNISVTSVYLSPLAFTGSSVYLSPIALSGASHASLSEDESFDINTLIDIDSQHTFCYVSTLTQIFSFDRFPGGEKNLLREVAEHLHIDCTQIDPSLIEGIPVIEMQEIVNKVLPDIKLFFTKLITGRKIIPRKILVSGRIARFRNIVNAIGKITGIPAQVWGIRGKVKLNYNVEGKRQFLYDEPALALAMGMFSKDIPSLRHPLTFKSIRRLTTFLCGFFGKNRQ